MNKPIPCEDCLMVPLCKSRIINLLTYLNITECSLVKDYAITRYTKNKTPVLSMEKIQTIARYLKER